MFTSEAIAGILNASLVNQLSIGNVDMVSMAMDKYLVSELDTLFNDSGWSVNDALVVLEAGLVTLSFKIRDPKSGSEVVKSKFWQKQELLRSKGAFTLLASLLLQEAVDELLKLVIPTHRITVSVDSSYASSKIACMSISQLIQGQMIGKIVGEHGGEKGCGTTYEVDQQWLDSAMARFNQVVERPPMLLGGRLISDVEELVADVRALTHPGADQEAFSAKWGHLLTVVIKAAKELARMDLPFEEIFVIGGRVRAMTSADYGRRDSGWFEIAQPSAN